MAKSPLVYLIDGHVYIFRAYFSIPEMPGPNGVHTGAAYGYANTLIKLLRFEQPSHIAVTFDYALGSFRNKIDPLYKANRVEAPPDLEPQFAFCQSITKALGIPFFTKKNFEADDILGTLTQHLLKRRARVVILTADKDLTQLVTEDGRVTWRDIAREIRLDADGVRKKFGVSPHQIPDYLGLVGDNVDNLPGVPGVGPKGASALLSAFPDIDAIPDSATDWPAIKIRGAERIAQRIQDHRERALLTRELATIRRDVPGIAPDLKDLRYRGAHRRETEALFDQFGWATILDRVPHWRGSSAKD